MVDMTVVFSGYGAHEDGDGAEPGFGVCCVLHKAGSSSGTDGGRLAGRREDEIGRAHV